LGFATKAAIERMVELEGTKEKEEHLARVAELLTIRDDEFSRRLSEPVEALEEQSSETMTLTSE
jgi:hypothetical protein